MPAQKLTTDAFVLLKRPPTESFQNFTLFSPEHGALHALQRLVKKTNSTSLALDLFDEATLQLESSNQGRTWFIKEVELLHRPAAIGQSYEVLRYACAFASLIVRNSVHEDSRASVAELFRSACEAFTYGVRPDIIYFKCLYRFSRDEGYPVKQQWFPSLPPADRLVVAALLNRPLAEQTAEPKEVARLERRLEEYLRGHTEILID